MYIEQTWRHAEGMETHTKNVCVISCAPLLLPPVVTCLLFGVCVSHLPEPDDEVFNFMGNVARLAEGKYDIHQEEGQPAEYKDKCDELGKANKGTMGCTN